MIARFLFFPHDSTAGEESVDQENPAKQGNELNSHFNPKGEFHDFSNPIEQRDIYGHEYQGRDPWKPAHLHLRRLADAFAPFGKETGLVFERHECVGRVLPEEFFD